MSGASSNTFVVFMEKDGYAVGPAHGGATVQAVAATAGTSPRDLAQAIVEAMRQIGRRAGGGIILALPSGACLCARVALKTARTERRRAMVFRLEEKLPLAAEDIAADFIVGANGALGVCVAIHSIGDLVAALEEAAVPVESICPAVFLALQGIGSTGHSIDECDAYLWGDAGSLELILLEQGHPRQWLHLPSDPEAAGVYLRLRALDQTSPLRIAAMNVSPVVIQAISLLEGVEVVGTHDQSISAVALAGAEQMRSGNLTPWIDLRRDGLAPPDVFRRFRRPLTAAMIAAMALLICMPAALFWRASQYQRLVRDCDNQLRQVFHQALPGQPFPATPRLRLASEERKLRAADGEGTGPVGESAMRVLYETLTRLPKDSRYSVTELRIEGGRLTLEGQARSHADAEAVATALRGHDGFRVQLPRTEQSDGRTGIVGFTLTATLPTAPAVTSAGRSASASAAFASPKEGAP